jgi:GH25 family lysozyme M1 (1,4-beta-N-acetylmuramidase)
MAVTKRKSHKKFRGSFTAAIIFLLLATALITWQLYAPSEEAADPTQPSTEPPQVPTSPFGVTDFSEENGYLACVGSVSMAGIDVSHHQQSVDWQQVKDSGIQFAVIRLGYRGIGDGSLNTDSYALANLTGAREAGLLVGAYFYSQATTIAEAEEEAAYALQILGDFKLDLPLAYDWEIESRTEAVDMQTATDCALAFCQAVTSAGHEAMIYFNSYQARERLDLLRLKEYSWWLAMYGTDSNFPCRFDIWQYTQTGSVPGIEGNVDVNVMIVRD